MEILDIHSEIVQKLLDNLGIDKSKVMSIDLHMSQTDPVSLTVQYFVSTKDMTDFTNGIKKYTLIEK